MESLTKEFEYYKSHQAEIVDKYEGKFIVIVDSDIIGSYDTNTKAIEESLKTHKLGEFLVQYVEAGQDNITQTFHSRVVFRG